MKSLFILFLVCTSPIAVAANFYTPEDEQWYTYYKLELILPNEIRHSQPRYFKMLEYDLLPRWYTEVVKEPTESIPHRVEFKLTVDSNGIVHHFDTVGDSKPSDKVFSIAKKVFYTKGLIRPFPKPLIEATLNEGLTFNIVFINELNKNRTSP